MKPSDGSGATWRSDVVRTGQTASEEDRDSGVLPNGGNLDLEWQEAYGRTGEDRDEPCRNLLRAVIAFAWKERDDSFFLGGGDRAEHFNELCDAINVDPHFLRREYRAFLFTLSQRPLTRTELKFIGLLALGLRKTRAATMVGYSSPSAGARLLAKPHIQQAIRNIPKLPSGAPCTRLQ